MADFAVVGDALVVPDGTPLSLAVGMDRLDAWLEIPTDADFRAAHATIRDEVMPDAVRGYVEALEGRDGVAAIDAVRRWSLALAERLGKCLASSSSGGTTVEPSHPTSGSDSGSVRTGPGATSPRRSRSRTPKTS